MLRLDWLSFLMSYIDYSSSPRFTATHIAKPHEPTLKPNACQRVCLSERTGESAAKLIDNNINKQKSPVPNKRSYAIGVLVVYQAFQLASGFVTGDRDAAPKSPAAHTAIRQTPEKSGQVV